MKSRNILLCILLTVLVITCIYLLNREAVNNKYNNNVNTDTVVIKNYSDNNENDSTDKDSEYSLKVVDDKIVMKKFVTEYFNETMARANVEPSHNINKVTFKDKYDSQFIAELILGCIEESEWRKDNYILDTELLYDISELLMFNFDENINTDIDIVSNMVTASLIAYHDKDRNLDFKQATIDFNTYIYNIVYGDETIVYDLKNNIMYINDDEIVYINEYIKDISRSVLNKYYNM